MPTNQTIDRMINLPGPFVHNIDPIFGQIGGFYLWWYGLSYTLGFLALFYWIRRVRRSIDFDIHEVYELSIVASAGVLIGGRLVEVFFYEWAYYQDHLLHIFWVWLGGMSTHGILLGGTIGVWLFCLVKGKNFLSVADELAIAGAFIMGVGRLGNFIDGQIVGSVTDVSWAVSFPDAEGFRHPVVLYDGLKNLALVPLLILLRTWLPYRGLLLGTFVFGYGFFRIVVDFFREYRVELFGLPPGQQFNIIMAVLGILLIIWALIKRHPRAVSKVENGIPWSANNLELNRGILWRRLALVTLLCIPTIIPSDWTQDVSKRYGSRHPGMTPSTLYPEIP